MITETLGSDLHRSAWIQTQLLKLYFLTTLYVDVKEPAFHHIPGTKKLNFVPTLITLPLSGRDKIEFQFAVPKCRENKTPSASLLQEFRRLAGGR